MKRAQALHAAELSQCEELASDLSLALKKSEAALATRRAAENPDATELGVMLLEQDRLAKELASQQAKVKSLQASAPAFDKSKFNLCAHRDQMVLTFGLNTISETTYQIVKSSNHPHVVPVKSDESPAETK